MPVALFLLGCGVLGLLDPEPEEAAIPPVTVDGVTFSAPLVRAPVAPPPLWDAPLPGVPGVPDPELDAVVDGICLDLPGARDAAEDVVGTDSWGALLGRCGEPTFCAWAAGRVPLPEWNACDPQPEPEAPDPLTNLRERLLDPEGTLDPIWLVARHPHHQMAIQGSLIQCVFDGAQSDGARQLAGRRCLAALASMRWNLAREALEAVPEDTMPYGWQTAAASLRRWATGEDMRDELVELELLAADASIPTGTLTPAELLVANGRGVVVEEHLGRGHQGRVLRRLLAVAGLTHARAVVFEPIYGTQRDGYFTQYVWLDRFRWRALAHDFGGFPDVVQATGLVNTLLMHRKSELRFILTDAEVDTLAFVVHPEKVAPLVEAGVILPWLPQPSEEAP